MMCDGCKGFVSAIRQTVTTLPDDAKVMATELHNDAAVVATLEFMAARIRAMPPSEKPQYLWTISAACLGGVAIAIGQRTAEIPDPKSFVDRFRKAFAPDLRVLSE